MIVLPALLLRLDLVFTLIIIIACVPFTGIFIAYNYTSTFDMLLAGLFVSHLVL